jgi:F-type H+-transporting ATPase subunit gamma
MRAEVLGSAIDSGAQDHEANGSPPAGVLRALVREFLFVSIFRACAESLASENASRLAAMDRADRNIDHLLVKLQGRYQRLRQSVIDEELADVISGFKAVGQMAEGRA